MSTKQENKRKNYNRRTNRKLVLAMKQQRGCDLCGEKNIKSTDLHFHHRDRKEKELRVSALVSRSTERFTREVLKCELWCRWAHIHYHRTGQIKCCRNTGGCP